MISFSSVDNAQKERIATEAISYFIEEIEKRCLENEIASSEVISGNLVIEDSHIIDLYNQLKVVENYLETLRGQDGS